MLYLLVFVAGMSGLAVEMAAARLLDPYFGNSLIVWANLIGLILLYLSAGYVLGGWLVDRMPREERLYEMVAWAAVGIGLVPSLASPVLRLATSGFADYDWALLAGSLLGVLALFSVPVTLLGAVSPYAIGLEVRKREGPGRVAGRIYALSTLGSILGTFLPVLVLIPKVGTRWTFWLLALVLWQVAFVGMCRARLRRAWLYLGVPVLVLALAWTTQGRPIKPDEALLYEAESAYNYIQVVQRGDDTLLKLNEGQGVHSVYNPHAPLTGAIFDYFLIAPFFNPPPYGADRVQSLCLIGLAGGTVADLYTRVYGPIWIDGAELDPRILEVARAYFGLRQPNVHAHAADGRWFLARSGRRYDVIAVDAYRPPYIPFHLTTQEFFLLAREHLTEHGVLAVNVARAGEDDRLVRALAATAATVFPSVFAIPEPIPEGEALGNTLLVATVRPAQIAYLAENTRHLAHPLLQEMAARTVPLAQPAPTDGPVLTDDKAPVEQIVHAIILRYLLGG
ncbi:MAG: fused MFS/spermidine synthase [Anaerolineae bacterium]|nr:fused MFS/spermidine synthase [Anaerolineae bacterium]